MPVSGPAEAGALMSTSETPVSAAASPLPAAGTGPTTYRVEFERIGRNHDVAPLVATAVDGDELVPQIHDYARPHLRLADLSVVISGDGATGSILCGLNSGGRFTVTPPVPVFPDQPDGLDPEAYELPDPARAAERVLAYVAAFGDGLYDVVAGIPLYGRDLEAVAKAALKAVAG